MNKIWSKYVNCKHYLFYILLHFPKRNFDLLISIDHLTYLKSIDYPLKKVTGYVSVCLSVPKDLANHSTDMVLLYSEASHRSWKEYYHPPKKNDPYQFLFTFSF